MVVKRAKQEIINEDVGQGVETVAASTIKAGVGAGSVGPQKIAVIQDFLGLMRGADSEMVEAFKKTMATFGPNTDHGVGDVADKNKSSIDAHNPNPVREAVQEDINALFQGTETITEEFKAGAVTLIEAAINSRVLLETEKLEASFDARLDEEAEQIFQFLTEKVNKYINYAANQWIDANQVAIDNTLRLEIAEQFIDGIKNVFVNSNVSIPEEKVDVVESLTAKVVELEGKLNESINNNIALTESVVQFEKSKSIALLTEGLSLLQKEKVTQLAEGVEFDGDFDVYNSKLKLIKESLVAKKTPQPTNLLTEEFEPDQPKSATKLSPEMERYSRVISRTSVKNA